MRIHPRITSALGAAAIALVGAAAMAQEAPESLKVYFDLGSARVEPGEQDKLDQAARLFREGQPYVMIVTGGADTVGPPGANLDLSLRRAQSVIDGLTARGIPVGRLQILGRGTSELAVETGDGVAERENRVAEITWR